MEGQITGNSHMKKDVMYFAPTELEEITDILARYYGKVTILAGGTDLAPKINYYQLEPENLLYIGGAGLDYIKVENQNLLIIGAAVPTAKLAANALVAEKASALAEAARQTGCVATRNAGTVGGNLANASPAADLATPLLVMGAHLRLISAGGKRDVAIADFFTGPGKTVLTPDELIVEIRVPSFRGKSVFLKLGRRKAMTLSVLNVAVGLDMSGRTCNEARIALGAMAPIPMRCTKAEQILNGKLLERPLITECAAEAVAASRPIDDQRATAWYRKKAGEALIVRALIEAAGIDSQQDLRQA
jgi:carbon-monoxide dehydrogenase medium subunit